MRSHAQIKRWRALEKGASWLWHSWKAKYAQELKRTRSRKMQRSPTHDYY